jgi:hypothetical protein
MHISHNKRVVRYFSWTNTIKFPQKIGTSMVADFASAIYQ